MARPRLPTAHLEANGAFKINPNRTRVDPEPAGPLGGPPAGFTPEQVAVWHEITSQCCRGVLTASDAVALESLVRLTIEMRTSGEVKAQTYTALTRLLGEFGMTPSSRAKLATAPKKPDNAGNAFEGMMQ